MSVGRRLGLEFYQQKSLCPHHDDHHASLTYNVHRNTVRCFACGFSADAIGLVREVLGVGFREACQWLANESGVILTQSEPLGSDPIGSFDCERYAQFFERPWLSEAARRFLYEERRLDPRVIRWCRITSWRDRRGVNWLQTPYYDIEGRLIGIQNRNLDYSRGGQVEGACQPGQYAPRFRFPQGSRCSVYNLPVLRMLSAGEQLFITEGCSDCWAMLSAGHKAIAIPSATLLKPQDVELLASYAARLSLSLHMYPDQDEPGERLFLQLKKYLPSLIRHELPADCKDFGELFRRNPSENRDIPHAD